MAFVNTAHGTALTLDPAEMIEANWTITLSALSPTGTVDGPVAAGAEKMTICGAA